MPALDALCSCGIPLNVLHGERQRGEGFHVDELEFQACRGLGLGAEVPTPQRVDAFEDGLMAYARARHAAGVFPRPAEARLYGVRQWLAANRVVPASVRLNLWLALGLLALCLVNVAGLLAARFAHRSG